MFTPELASARWTKSSFSTSGSCVEIAHGTTWVKSSFSGGNGDCVEIAQGDAWVAVRDSKNPDGPALTFDRKAMDHFLAEVKSGQFDLV